MRKVVIAGGSGFIGTAASELLVKLGYDVVVLSRTGKADKGARGVVWNGATAGPWTEEIEGAFAVVNLTGASIAQKWTPEAKDEILQSRVRSTQAIGQAIQAAKDKPKVWINGSAVGYYGNRGSDELTEASTPGKKKDFVVDTTVAWEATCDRYETPGVRRIKLRTGLVLGNEGGPFPPLLAVTKKFLGGHHGRGDQFMSWIHIQDMARLIVFCIEGSLEGPVNATAPEPCTNRFFMAAMRGIAGRPWCPGVPAFVLKVASWFGAPDPSLLLHGQRVMPKAVREAGFRFNFEELREALVNLIK